MIKTYSSASVLFEIKNVFGLDPKKPLKNGISFTMTFSDYIAGLQMSDRSFVITQEDVDNFISETALPITDIPIESLLGYEIVIFGFQAVTFDKAFFIGGLKEGPDDVFNKAAVERKDKVDNSHYNSIMVLSKDPYGRPFRAVYEKNELTVFH